MSPSINRKRIRCEPIEGVWAEVYRNNLRALPTGYAAVALLFRESVHIPDGVLVQTPAGYMHYLGGAVRSIDQRKALAALDDMADRQTAKDRGDGKI